MHDGSDQTAAHFLRALSSVLSQVAPPSQVLKTILGQSVSQTGADRGLLATIGSGGRLDFRISLQDPQGGPGRRGRPLQPQHLQGSRRLRREHPARQRDGRPPLRPQGVDPGPQADLDPLHADRGRRQGRRDRPPRGQPAGPLSPNSTRAWLRSMLDVAAPTLGALQASEGMMRERDEARRSATLAWKELEESREMMAREWSFARFIGRTPAVRELEESVHKASETEFPVLLLGETGTGKSIVARVLHHASPRAKGPFVTVFCPSLEKGMVETELFGHKRGAFTGAVADRLGKVPGGREGNALPGRDRRAAARDPAQAVAPPAGEDLRPGRRSGRARRQRAGRRRDQPRPRRRSSRGPLPSRPLRAAELRADPHPAVARADRRHSALALPPGRAVRRRPLGRAGRRRRAVPARARLRLAGQRAPPGAPRRSPGDGAARQAGRPGRADQAARHVGLARRQQQRHQRNRPRRVSRSDSPPCWPRKRRSGCRRR